MASKGKSIVAVTAITSNATTEAGKYVTRQSIQQLPFWGKLKERERADLVEEVRQFAAARLVHGSSGLALGERLVNIKAILEPHKGAYKKVLSGFNFTEKTAKRYIDGYENARANLPTAVLKAAMARGMRLLGYDDAKPLGVYTEAYRLLPPPRDPDPEQANRYIKQLEQTYKERKRAVSAAKKSGKKVDREQIVQRNPKALARDAYRAVRNALTHVSARKKREFLDTHVGMLLTEIGIGSKTSFSPEAIPEEFAQGRGRPRLVPELGVDQEERQARVM